MSKTELKELAVSLRKKGFSIKEIAKQLTVAQSTVSLWVRKVSLSKENKIRIRLIQDEARKNAGETNKKKKIQREQNVISACEVLKKPSTIGKVDAKIYLALLYWGEGAKTGNRVVFVNSDPEMIKSFANLLRKCFSIDEKKMRAVLHLHSYHDKQKMIDFWSKCSDIKKENISIYNKQESGITKKSDYKGCFSLRYGDVATFQELLLIIDRFKKLVYN